MADRVGVGIVGSGFIADIHAVALGMVPDAQIIGVASPTPGKARHFAEERKIPHAYEDYRELMARDDVDVVLLGLPNYLHCEAALAAAAAGKHIIVEKPMAVTVAECDRMIAACKDAGVLLMYAEELCFAPKYVRAKTLCDEGGLGTVFKVYQAEEHSGPHMPWFWDIDKSGGGVLLDMGCHSIEFGRWILGKRPVKSVSASMGTYVHQDKTRGEDHTIVVVEYEGAMAVAENSWAKLGGVDDRCEIYGSGGFTRADLLRGSALLTYSEPGYGYAVEKAGTTQGYSFTMFEETWNYGFPQEMAHFIRCVQGREKPIETGEDGREVLKIICAAYQSAGEGRKIEFPYEPPADLKRPSQLWLGD